MLKRNVLLAAIALSAGVGCAWRGETTTANAAWMEIQIVPVAKATLSNLSGSVTLTGEFEPYQEVDVMAKVAGYIRTITVDIGDRVTTGQVLATLEIPEMQNDVARAGAAVEQSEAELASARDEVERAESASDIARISFQRIQDVSKREPGLVPAQEVDEAHSKALVAEAQVSAAKSNLLAAEQRTRGARMEETRIQTMYAYSCIVAPFDGVVTKRYASVGSMIQAGTASQSQAMPVVRVSQNNLLRLILPAPESIVPRIHNGESVDVLVTSLHTIYPGRVTRSADKVREDTRTMDTEVDISNPRLDLVPGMYAEVTLSTEERRQVLAVPVDAVEAPGAGAQVLTVDSRGVIKRVPVVTGMETDQRIEVRSGLREGDSVVVGRHAGLREGQVVRTKLSDAMADAKAPGGVR
jgi:RND family efflux transporter MFP subunit